jgi:hypothetical protein
MQSDDSTFFPRGAVAFFAAMIVFYAAIWFLLMAVMIRRG